MAWGYWSATTVDRGRSPRRNTQCVAMPVNTVPQSEPPPPVATCYSPTCRSRCTSPCHSPCPDSPCQSVSPPLPAPPSLAQCSQMQQPQQPPQPILPPEDYSRRASLDRLDSPQVILVLVFAQKIMDEMISVSCNSVNQSTSFHNVTCRCRFHTYLVNIFIFDMSVEFAQLMDCSMSLR